MIIPKKRKRTFSCRLINILLVLALLSGGITGCTSRTGGKTSVLTPSAITSSEKLITTTTHVNLPVLRGIQLDSQDPFQFNFIIDQGADNLIEEKLKEESARLIKYFLSSLTIAEQDLWVNLSPYEGNKIVPESLGLTEMGKDLLGQDYILKQLMASLTYPETELGRDFWFRVYQRAQSLFGTTKIPINTFNKIWIVPEKAVVYEDKDRALVGETKLKVMMEEDYLLLKDNLNNPDIQKSNLNEGEVSDINNFSSQIMKEVILPVIEEEVNEGENFAMLRQIYHSLILAVWFKQKLKENIINRVYSDQNKIKGVDTADPDIKDKIYSRYIEAYQKGAYDYIKKDYDTATRKTIQRRYFSGGFDGTKVSSAIRFEPLEESIELGRAALSSPVEIEVQLSAVSGEELKKVLGNGEMYREDDDQIKDTLAREIAEELGSSGRSFDERLRKGIFPFNAYHLDYGKIEVTGFDSDNKMVGIKGRGGKESLKTYYTPDKFALIGTKEYRELVRERYETYNKLSTVDYLMAYFYIIENFPDIANKVNIYLSFASLNWGNTVYTKDGFYGNVSRYFSQNLHTTFKNRVDEATAKLRSEKNVAVRILSRLSFFLNQDIRGESFYKKMRLPPDITDYVKELFIEEMNQYVLSIGEYIPSDFGDIHKNHQWTQQILSFKGGDTKDIGQFSDSIASKTGEVGKAFDVITVVPQYGEESNVLLPLGRNVSEKLSVPFEQVLVKTRPGQKQRDLDYDERFGNVRDLYKVTDEVEDDVKGKRVLLIDDVITTQATAFACMKELLEAGAEEVYVIGLGKTHYVDGNNRVSSSIKQIRILLDQGQKREAEELLYRIIEQQFSNLMGFFINEQLAAEAMENIVSILTDASNYALLDFIAANSWFLDKYMDEDFISDYEYAVEERLTEGFLSPEEFIKEYFTYAFLFEEGVSDEIDVEYLCRHIKFYNLIFGPILGEKQLNKEIQPDDIVKKGNMAGPGDFEIIDCFSYVKKGQKKEEFLAARYHNRTMVFYHSVSHNRWRRLEGKQEGWIFKHVAENAANLNTRLSNRLDRWVGENIKEQEKILLDEDSLNKRLNEYGLFFEGERLTALILNKDFALRYSTNWGFPRVIMDPLTGREDKDLAHAWLRSKNPERFREKKDSIYLIVDKQERLGNSGEKKLSTVFTGEVWITASLYAYKLGIAQGELRSERYTVNRKTMIDSETLNIGEEYTSDDGSCSLKVDKKEGVDGFILEIEHLDKGGETIVEWEQPLIVPQEFKEIKEYLELKKPDLDEGEYDNAAINLSRPSLFKYYREAKNRNILLVITRADFEVNFLDEVMKIMKEIPQKVLYKSAEPLPYHYRKSEEKALGRAEQNTFMGAVRLGETYFKDEGLIDTALLAKVLVHELIGHKLSWSKDKEGKRILEPEIIIEAAKVLQVSPEVINRLEELKENQDEFFHYLKRRDEEEASMNEKEKRELTRITEGIAYAVVKEYDNPREKYNISSLMIDGIRELLKVSNLLSIQKEKLSQNSIIHRGFIFEEGKWPAYEVTAKKNPGSSSPLSQSESEKSALSEVSKGGIDLTTDTLNIETRSEGLSSPVIDNIPFDIQNFQGFKFQILHIKRIDNITTLFSKEDLAAAD